MSHHIPPTAKAVGFLWLDSVIILKNINKFKDILLNEDGGPTIETMVGIGVSLGVVSAIYALGRNLYRYLHSVPGGSAGYSKSIVVGYKK